MFFDVFKRVILYMHSSPHFFSQPASQQDSHQRYINDFCHKDNGLREDRASRMAHTDGEEENGQCAQNDQRQGDGCIPAVAGMEPGDDAEVHGNAQTVQKQGDPENGFRWKEYRQAEDPQDDADADDVKGPVGECDK